MKRVCFVTELLFAETRNLKHIRELLEQLMAEGPVECWFYKCCRPFAVQALETIMEIREERPDAELEVVDVVDPLETETENMDWSEQEECDFFPAGTVDRFITAPVFAGKAGKNGQFVSTRWRKVNKWVWEQCDCIAAYYYDDLLHDIAPRIKRTAEKKQIKLVHFYSKETEALIKKKAKCLEGEDGILYNRRLKGDTFKEMAENMHTPLPSLMSHTHKAIGKLYNLTVAELRRQGKLYSSPFSP